MNTTEKRCTDIIRPDTERIKELLKSASPSECRKVLESVLEDMHFREMKSLMLRLYTCVDIYMTARAFAKEIGVPDEQFSTRFGSVDDIESRLCTDEATVEFLYEMLLQCMEWRAGSACSRGGSTMQTAMRYIDENYMNCELSLGTVAEAVGLSPSYLSMLFKKETGTNFSDHLTRVRIHRAKELLCCTNKMVYEVAYDVGFSDYRYFSQIFKKNTGMTPRQFQYSINSVPEKKIS